MILLNRLQLLLEASKKQCHHLKKEDRMKKADTLKKKDLLSIHIRLKILYVKKKTNKNTQSSALSELKCSWSHADFSDCEVLLRCAVPHVKNSFWRTKLTK